MPFKFKPKECEGCVLHNPFLESTHETSKFTYERAFAGRGFSSFDGLGTNGVVVMLESLGDNEVDDGVPVRPHAPAGSVFERAINRSPGLMRSQFKIGNTIQCQPPFNKLIGTKWGQGAIEHCQIHRDKLLSLPMSGPNYKQRIILALGAVPFKQLTGLEGEYLNLEAIRGYPIETPYGIVIGSYHPSHIVQGAQKLMGVLMLDMRKAVNMAKNGFAPKPLTYQTNPNYDDVHSFLQKCKDNVNMPLAFDIETPNVNEDGSMPNQIFSVQFSLQSQTGIFMNWMGYELDVAKEILKLNNPKIVYNGWRFDVPMLKNVGGCEINGRIDDVIWAFHHYQPDLTIENKAEGDASISSRMGLQYVASFFGMDFHWKYMKKYKEMQRHYGIADVDALHRIWDTLPQQMKQMNVWQGYDKLRYELEPVLVNMSQRGIPVDNNARIDLREVIQLDMTNQFDLMQGLVPLELRNIEPKGGYKKGWSAVKVKDGKIRQISD